MSATVPEGWCDALLGEVAAVQLGKMLSAKAKTGRGARPYLRNVNIRWHRIDVHDVLQMDFDTREVTKYRLERGDVLVCEGGEPGRAAVWANQLPGALYQKALHRVRFHGECVDSHYFVYFLELVAYEGLLAGRFTGSTIKHLPREAFIDVPIPVAPRAEQRRIVAALEEHLSELDAAVAGLERARANILRFRASVLRAACRGELCSEPGASARVSSLDSLVRPGAAVEADSRSVHELPRGWSWVSLDALTTKVTSGSRDWSRYYGRGSGTFIMAQNVRPGRLDLSFRQAVDPPADDRDRDRSQVQANDVLITIVGANTGDVCRVPHDLPEHFVCQSVALVRPFRSEVGKWLELYLMSPEDGQRQFDRNIYGQGRPHLSFDQLRMVAIPVPPLEVQRQILDEVERRLDASGRVKDDIDTQLARATRLRQAILKRAFEGKLVPQDPNDEPASVLLDRIRAERAREAAPERRRRAKSTTTPRSRRR